jgi:hypothetical protein
VLAELASTGRAVAVLAARLDRPAVVEAADWIGPPRLRWAALVEPARLDRPAW